MPYEPTNPPCPKCKNHHGKWPELKDTGTEWYCYFCDNYFEKLPGKKPGKKIGELYIGSAEHKKQKEDGPGGIHKGKKLFGMNQLPGANIKFVDKKYEPNDQIKLIVKHLG